MVMAVKAREKKLLVWSSHYIMIFLFFFVILTYKNKNRCLRLLLDSLIYFMQYGAKFSMLKSVSW